MSEPKRYEIIHVWITRAGLPAMIWRRKDLSGEYFAFVGTEIDRPNDDDQFSTSHMETYVDLDRIRPYLHFHWRIFRNFDTVTESIFQTEQYAHEVTTNGKTEQDRTTEA